MGKGRISKRHTAGVNPVSALNDDGFLKSSCYKAGIYARLSSAQDEKKSESIDVQTAVAEQFAQEWNQSHTDKIEIIDYYIDLGKTGTNFNRDAFKRLMQDVRMGDINCVIVKDLSRFGRNYLEAGNYIEKIFPFLGVRFIAVADGYDTGKNGNDTKQMVSEIKNLVNDMYAKDFSVKARTSLVQRRKEGAYVGGIPPYGYKTVWEGKLRKLVPDENTAELVRYIYEKFIETRSYTAVADALSDRKINPPAVYHKTGEAYCPPKAPYKRWDKSGVKRILKSETYMGMLVQGKTSITARDERNRIHKPEDEWVITKEAHEPLIERKIFEQAGSIRQTLWQQTKNHRHTSKGGSIEENIFDKVLFCGVCGRKMIRHSVVGNGEDNSKTRIDKYFCCYDEKKDTNIYSQSGCIAKIELTDILFSLFETEFALHLKKQKAYVEMAREPIRQKKTVLERSLRIMNFAKERLAVEEGEKYIAYRMEKLSSKEYVAYKMQREDRMGELEKQEKRLKEQLFKLERKGEAYLKAVRAVTRLKDRRVLTKLLIETLIEKIYVYPKKRIEVLFSCSEGCKE